MSGSGETAKRVLDEIMATPNDERRVMTGQQLCEFLLTLAECGSDLPVFTVIDGKPEAQVLMDRVGAGSCDAPQVGRFIGRAFGRNFYAQPLEATSA